MIELILGDCLEKLKDLPDNSVDSIVTDPPYGLSFMGKKWDYDVPSEDIWRECLRVLKPGGHLLAFAGTRTQHRMAVRIEDAGFEIRDMIAWCYGSGFPKSHNIGKAVDKLQGNEREVTGKSDNGIAGGSGEFTQGNPKSAGFKSEFEITKGTSPHEGWGTALKPALEPITVARKPLTGTVASNVLEWGTGGINVDGCRVDFVSEEDKGDPNRFKNAWSGNGSNDGWRREAHKNYQTVPVGSEGGRFPANLIHDGSEETISLFPGEADKNASRFFYCAKASKKDRDEGLDTFQVKTKSHITTQNFENALTGSGNERNIHHKNNHPTVKPTDLMRYLCRLVTPRGGIVLDPFMGSGSTGKAAVREGFNFIGIELDPDYMEIAKARIQ